MTLVTKSDDAHSTWGYWQFPKIAFTDSGALLYSFEKAIDDATKYGETGRCLFIANNSEWKESFDSELFGYFDAVTMPSGVLLSLRQMPPWSQEELKLTPYGGRFASYDGTRLWSPFFRFCDLAKEKQLLPLYRCENDVWKRIEAPLNAPGKMLYSYKGLVPNIYFGNILLLIDGSLLACTYPHYHEGDEKTRIAFFKSADEGLSWSLWSSIPYLADPEADFLSEVRSGYTEPWAVQLRCGDLLCVFRTCDGSFGIGPLFASRSKDGGKTWSSPRVFYSYGVMPQLLYLSCGVLCCSFGRPGVRVLFSYDDGATFSNAIDIVTPEYKDPRKESCGYTSLLEDRDGSLLVAYSHFREHKELHLARITPPPAPPPPPSEIGCAYTLSFRPDKSLHKIFPTKDGAFNGLVREYFVSGVLAREIPYENGVCKGYIRTYSRHGYIIDEKTVK